MLSDAVRTADWRAALAEKPRHVGLILRDYAHPERPLLAAEMAQFCRQSGRRFAVAGDRRLARRLAAAFHCPTYLLARPAARLGAAAPHDMAAVHNLPELRRAAAAGFKNILLSPVFATASHPDAVALGPLRAVALLRAARQHGMTSYALGGMNARAFHRLGGRDWAQGWAGIDAFGPPAK